MSIAQIWDRLWADVTTPIEAQAATMLIALGAVLVCIAVSQLWAIVRHGVTIAHEGGHALAAWLTGRRVSGIRLHSDTSGLTTSYGEVKRLPLTLVALAGYPAPGALGLAAAWMVASGHAVAVLWALEAALLMVLVGIRNWFGFLVMVIAIAGLGAAAWYAPDPWRVGLACALVWLLLLGAVRAVIELSRSRRGGRGRGSDADALARLTRIPGGVWVGAFWVVTVACLAAGGWTVVGPLLG